MTPAEAKKWVIPAVAIAGITAAVSDVANNKQFPRVRIAIGGVIIAAILTFIADFAPGLASGFAAILLVGALLLKGGVFSKVATILS